jgi:GNAT superfamily N-acetyltransferase
VSAGPTIRQAEPSDLSQVLALYEQPGLSDSHSLTLHQAEQMLEVMASYPNYRLFVACDGDEVVATYALLVMHNLAHGGAPSAIAEDVVVTVSRRGEGLGRLLMAHAVAEAAAAGCYKLALSSNARRKAAHAFYESLGFSRHGVSFAIDPQAGLVQPDAAVQFTSCGAPA